ncbi:unnamed protein product [Caenorhabditis nigoni]
MRACNSSAACLCTPRGQQRVFREFQRFFGTLCGIFRFEIAGNMQPESILDIRTDNETILSARSRPVTRENQIHLAIVLVGSENAAEIEEGVAILEEIAKDTEHSEDVRISVYYLALAHARLQNYDRSTKILDALLSVEPANLQASELRKVVQKKMKKEALLGLGLVGGAAALIGGIVIAGFALKK